MDKRVLILVLMEDTLGVFQETLIKKLQPCLNPCFNGRYSRSERCSSRELCSCVLILVLMEDTLGDYKRNQSAYSPQS